MLWRSAQAVAALALVLTACGGSPEAASDADGDAGVRDASAADARSEGDATPVGDANSEDSGQATDCVRLDANFPISFQMPNAEPNGSFDPNLEKDPVTGRLWMAYSGVDGLRVSTHLAYSDDDGVTWCYQALVNRAETVPREQQPAAIAQDHAHWNHETSSLVYDPAAPADSRWLLMWARYLYVEDNVPGTEDRHFEYGWIAGRRAATPSELVNAHEFKLFSALGYHASTEIEAYNNAVEGGVPEKRWDSDPDLHECVAFSEPGAMAANGKLYVTLPCPYLSGNWDIAIVAYDHATKTWRHVHSVLPNGTAVDGFDGIAFFNGPDLVQTANGARLLVSPVDKSGAAYAGCLGFPIDLAAGTITETPTYKLHRPADAEIYQSGPCTYAAGSSIGVLSGDVHLHGIQFTLLATGQTLP